MEKIKEKGGLVKEIENSRTLHNFNKNNLLVVNC